mgnify:CR=1 FL=1
MARRTQHALQRQLKRERAHLRWLEQHLPQSMQLSLSKERIAKLAAQSAILSDSKQKKRCTSNARPLCIHVHIGEFSGHRFEIGRELHVALA